MFTYESGQIAFICEKCPNLVDFNWIAPTLSLELRALKVESLSFPRVMNFAVKDVDLAKSLRNRHAGSREPVAGCREECRETGNFQKFL